MAGVDAGVDDRDRHAGAAADRPRLGRVDVGVGRAAVPPDRLAGVVQAPQEAGERLRREPARLVRLGPRDVRVGAQRGERRRRGRRSALTTSTPASGSVALGRDAGVARSARVRPPSRRTTISSRRSAGAARAGARRRSRGGDGGGEAIQAGDRRSRRSDPSDAVSARRASGSDRRQAHRRSRLSSATGRAASSRGARTRGPCGAAPPPTGRPGRR